MRAAAGPREDWMRQRRRQGWAIGTLVALAVVANLTLAMRQPGPHESGAVVALEREDQVARSTATEVPVPAAVAVPSPEAAATVPTDLRLVGASTPAPVETATTGRRDPGADRAIERTRRSARDRDRAGDAHGRTDRSGPGQARRHREPKREREPRRPARHEELRQPGPGHDGPRRHADRPPREDRRHPAPPPRR